MKNYSDKNLFIELFKITIFINIIGNLIDNISKSGSLLYFNLIMLVVFFQIKRNINKKNIEYYIYILIEVILIILAVANYFW